MSLTKEEHARELKIKEVREGLADEYIFEMSDEQFKHLPNNLQIEIC